MKLLPQTYLTGGVFGRSFMLMEDFFDYASAAAKLTLTTTAGGALSLLTGISGGVAALNPNAGVAANNDDGNVYSANDIAFPAIDKPFYFESRIGYTEVATNVAAVAAGFMSSCGLNTIVNGGLTLRTSFTGATWFKTNGSLLWSVVSSIGTSQTITQTNITAPGDGSYHTLGVEMQPVTGTGLYEVSYYYDGVVATDANNRRIKHNVTLGTPAAMRPNISVKNGSAAAQVVNIDYIGVAGLR